jgi:hypothetical protein
MVMSHHLFLALVHPALVHLPSYTAPMLLLCIYTLLPPGCLLAVLRQMALVLPTVPSYAALHGSYMTFREWLLAAVCFCPLLPWCSCCTAT